MPTRIIVGVCRKIGLPNYGSNGANCSVELEIDTSLLDRDPAAFQQKIRDAFAICENAVALQLATTPSESAKDDVSAAVTVQDAETNGNASNVSDQMIRPIHRPSTESQRRAISNMAQRQRLNLPELLQERYGVSNLVEIDLLQASRLIDDLKNSFARATADAS